MWESNKKMREPVPFTNGIELRVFASGVVSGTIRSCIECPFEYAKVKLQTGQNWILGDVYKGFTNLYPRSTLMMTTYFIQIDSYRRHTNVFKSKLG
jgi:hypothetical protein